MFALFFNLYLAMFTGNWSNYSLTDFFQSGRNVHDSLESVSNTLGQFLTSIFGNGNMTTLGTDFFNNLGFLHLVSFILALITSIGIVVVAVKGVKRAFGIFFMGIRR